MSKLHIILDFGHGVDTPGKRSPDGKFREWKWNREFGEMLYDILVDNGYSCEILVPEDTDVSLSNRVLREKTITKNMKKKGYETLLISIHVNASSGNNWTNARGTTAWVYSSASNKSKNLAKMYSQQIDRLSLKGNRWVPKTGYFEANYYILKNTSCPAVLIEHDFMTSREGVAFLESSEGKKRFLEMHRNAIDFYIDTYGFEK